MDEANYMIWLIERIQLEFIDIEHDIVRSGYAADLIFKAERGLSLYSILSHKYKVEMLTSLQTRHLILRLSWEVKGDVPHTLLYGWRYIMYSHIATAKYTTVYFIAERDLF